MRLVFIFFISAIGISCNSRKIGNQCYKSLFFTEGLALNFEIRNTEDGKFVSNFFSALNNSEYQEAYNILNTLSRLYKDSLNKYFFGTPIPGTTDKESHYIIYRLQEYWENSNKRILSDDLTKMYSTERISTGSTSCLNALAEIEYDYLSFYSIHDSIKKKEQLTKFSKYLQEYSESFRIKYLYGKLNYDMGIYEVALPVFKNLIEERYYEVPIFESLFEFYSQRDIDTLKHFSEMFSKRFPMYCNLGNLSVLVEGDQEEKFMTECKKCLKSENSTDSIRANITLGRFYLKKRDFNKVDALYNDYKENNESFEPGDFKIWETGEYYDIYLRNLFLQSKFVDIYNFINQEMGYNKKIKIEHEGDFYRLMKLYYNEYNEKEKANFDIFYNKNFYWIKRYFAYSPALDAATFSSQ